MNVTYRQATIYDVSQLSELRWSFKTEGLSPIEVHGKDHFLIECCKFLEQGLETGRWCCWLAQISNDIISNVFIQRIQKVPKPGKFLNEFGYLTNIYTKPEFRGQGIGAELVKRAQDWAKENDLEFLIVWPDTERLAWYQRLGFKRSAEAYEHDTGAY
jgi:GNAT superfamily N-acetyltransferase